MERTTFAYDDTPIPVTISLGVATLAPTDTDSLALIARADERLYQAKHDGRNSARG
ncbi:MAG: diguanylate cyclase [Candidatus Sumerlaeia bacterium]|nr:diguanylate cyclase [Candidatus Sumerlaeia bacterium]